MARSAEREKIRLRRSESFLGIHFDFHAAEDCLEIGKNTTRRMIEQIIEQVRPDYIQCDCKGHRGMSSYPTDVGNRAPGILGDPLLLWREVTAEHGVALYLHYSGVWDTEALNRNPDWARVDESGRLDPNNTSVFGPYVDELLIPQLKELSDKYGIDGVWIDGECWSTCHDYGDRAIRAFREQTGIENVPRGPEDPFYYEFSEFCREAFRRYVRHYVGDLHRHNPDFQIASNWAFSSQMPEPVSADVDFISGDYTMQNSVNSARWEGRAMAGQGKPWDLMAWSFGGSFGAGQFTTKGAAQLKQEAAVVLALGGGFQAYFTQKRDGSVSLWQMRLMAETAAFCRERQELCHRAERVPQIALLYSGYSAYRQHQRLFLSGGPVLEPIKGVLQALLHSQQVVDVAMEHHLTGRMSDYPLIVVPEWPILEPDFLEELIGYVRAGGSLLLIGSETATLFESELDISFSAEKQEQAKRWLEADGWLGVVQSSLRPVVLGQRARPYGKLYLENDNIGPYDHAATITDCGKGKIAAVYFDYGERYLHAATSTARRFLHGLVRELFPEPLVEVEGSGCVDVALARKDGKLIIHLINTSGPHANSQVYAFDELDPVGPLSVTVRCGSEPSGVTLEPSGGSLPFEYRDGEVHLEIGRVNIHEMIVLEGLAE